MTPTSAPHITQTEPTWPLAVAIANVMERGRSGCYQFVEDRAACVLALINKGDESGALEMAKTCDLIHEATGLVDYSAHEYRDLNLVEWATKAIHAGGHHRRVRVWS